MGFFDFFKKNKAESELDIIMKKMALQLFPNGEADIMRDTNVIHGLFGGKLTIEECKKFVTGRKALICIAEDKSAERIVPSLIISTGNKITQNEAYQAYLYLSGGGVSYSGGDGSTVNTPVVIHAQTSEMGVPAEYAYVAKRYGKRDEAWKLKIQYLLKSDSGRDIDLLVIELPDGNEVNFHFDITEFFGKF
ncbi:MAG: hypothetical protein A2X85_17445 [Geobacteraceae bacterium GWF2_54_21]|nr:MAG: hypothetical protein A2X85_17445 [Geobacteraceae bacterium GWF2_54_21]